MVYGCCTLFAIVYEGTLLTTGLTVLTGIELTGVIVVDWGRMTWFGAAETLLLTFVNSVDSTWYVGFIDVLTGVTVVLPLTAPIFDTIGETDTCTCSFTVPFTLVVGPIERFFYELFFPAKIAAKIPPKASNPKRPKSKGPQHDLSSLATGTGGATTLALSILLEFHPPFVV